MQLSALLFFDTDSVLGWRPNPRRSSPAVVKAASQDPGDKEAPLKAENEALRRKVLKSTPPSPNAMKMNDECNVYPSHSWAHHG